MSEERYIYTTEKNYQQMRRIYTQLFNKGPKIFRCTKRVRIIEDTEEK